MYTFEELKNYFVVLDYLSSADKTCYTASDDYILFFKGRKVSKFYLVKSDYEYNFLEMINVDQKDFLNYLYDEDDIACGMGYATDKNFMLYEVIPVNPYLN